MAVLSAEGSRTFVDSIRTAYEDETGRHRRRMGPGIHRVMIFGLVRISAIVGMRVEDDCPNGKPYA
jgi:hypothetical protein